MGAFYIDLSENINYYITKNRYPYGYGLMSAAVKI